MTDIKERPILFSAPMVRAILEGRKTVTRRPVKGGQIPTEDPAEEGRHRWSAIAQRDPRYGVLCFWVDGGRVRQGAGRVRALPLRQTR